MVSPVLEKASCLRRDVPVARVGHCSPLLNGVANLVDDRGVVLLCTGGNACFVLESKRLLRRTPLSFLRPRDRVDELSLAPDMEQLLSWTSLIVELPMLHGDLVRRVDDWV